MFTSLIQRVNDRTAILENFLRLCSTCDEAVANEASTLFHELSSRNALPSNLREERTFRHCAVITQLYNIYEAFAESALTIWLARLPRYHSLSDLPETLRNAYRHGIGGIIQNIAGQRYRHLSIDKVLEKYLASVQGISPWEIVNEALTSHDTNLRREKFEQMFNLVGLEGVWSEIEKNAQILSLTTERDAKRSLQQTILELVTYRNEASHGTPDDLLGLDILSEWVLFIKAFCYALAEAVLHRVVLAEATHKPESVLGVITEIFSDNIAVATCDRGKIKVGDKIYFLRESDCTNAMIESIQLNEIDQSEIEIDRPGVEVGLRTSIKIHLKSRLVRVENHVDEGVSRLVDGTSQLENEDASSAAEF
ncbi:MAG: MAE_28990/MAE_18760 family HEPN-like nuclease [Acidobacteriota bacterium]